MIFTSVSQGLSHGESSPGFWRAQIVGWLFLALVGYFIRLAVFGNAVAAFWLTLGLEPLAFALTSAAAVLHGHRSGKGDAPILTLACAVLLCLAASALLASIAYAIHHVFPPGSLRVLPGNQYRLCLLYTSPSPRDGLLSRMPSSA